EKEMTLIPRRRLGERESYKASDVMRALKQGFNSRKCFDRLWLLLGSGRWGRRSRLRALSNFGPRDFRSRYERAQIPSHSPGLLESQRPSEGRHACSASLQGSPRKLAV